MKLMGAWNWWMPSWLDRALPDLSFEGGSAEQLGPAHLSAKFIPPGPQRGGVEMQAVFAGEADRAVHLGGNAGSGSRGFAGPQRARGHTQHVAAGQGFPGKVSRSRGAGQLAGQALERGLDADRVRRPRKRQAGSGRHRHLPQKAQGKISGRPHPQRGHAVVAASFG